MSSVARHSLKMCSFARHMSWGECTMVRAFSHLRIFTASNAPQLRAPLPSAPQRNRIRYRENTPRRSFHPLLLETSSAQPMAEARVAMTRVERTASRPAGHCHWRNCRFPKGTESRNELKRCIQPAAVAYPAVSCNALCNQHMRQSKALDSYDKSCGVASEEPFI